ncbi:MAG: signal peptidase I [Anaerolineae bacterium]|nr:signal peptidase I [Anaerolineae bacterium]
MEHTTQPRATSQSSSWLREFVQALLPALLIVLVINAFIAQATRVDGLSMMPNLRDNDRLIIEKISYRLHPPERSDIVVLNPPSHTGIPLIKRVIGLPGEVIAIEQGHVLINNEILSEPYLTQPTPGTYAPHLIPEGRVFVMGDNRSASNDSRAFGPVAYEHIVGKAWFRYWPLDEIGLVKH